VVIEFDRAKADANLGKHKLLLDAALLVFDGRYTEEVDHRQDYGEVRLIAIGPVATMRDRLCVVVYTWRSGNRRIISFRKANAREIRKYRRCYP